MENIGVELARVTFYLLLIIGLMYLISYFLKRSISGRTRGRYIQIIEQVYLAPKKSFTLLKVNGQIFLMANTETDSRLIYTWKEEDFPGAAIPEKEESFRNIFNKLTGVYRRGNDEK